MNLTHRARLVLSAATVSGFVLAVLFIAASALYIRFEVVEEFDSLSPTVRQAMQAAYAGHVVSEVQAISAAEPNVSLCVERRGVVVAQGGKLEVDHLYTSGRTTINGVQVTSLIEQKGPFRVVAARPWQHREESAKRFAFILAILWFPLVGLIAGTTALASRATFDPLDDLRREADQARARGLHGRLRVKGQGEYAEFANSLNGFLEHIEQLIDNEEQFVADAAHELRTPLTALRGKVETTLLRERSVHEYESAMRDILREAERLSSLVEALLGSATAVSSRPAPPLDLSVEVEKAHARWIDRYIDAGVMLEFTPRPVQVCMTTSEIGSILDNLLGNALRMSPSGSTCQVTIQKLAHAARLSVQDEGPGVPEEMREKIFNRFVRGLEPRNSSGFGIGLSLCRRIVEARGGTIGVVPSEAGACFVVDLPRED